MVSHSLRTGLLLAIAVTLLLNASAVAILVTGPQAALERKTDAMDEDFYLSLIREAAEGHTLLGNSSLREHRDDPSIVTFLPLIPGLLIRLFGVGLGTVLFLTDVLFPFLTTFFFFIAWRGLYKSAWVAAAATLVALSVWGGGLLNVVNPKMVVTFAAAYFALFFSVQQPSRRTYLLRGSLLSLMLYAYPHYFLYFGVLEGCDAMRRVLREHLSLAQLAQDMAFLLGAFLVLSIPYFSLAWNGGQSEAAADLWHRQVIPSHLPASPRMQLALLIGSAALCLLWRRERRTRTSHAHEAELLLVCLTAGIIVLNQSIVHGLDIMFGLHYRLLLTLILLLSSIFCFCMLIREPVVQRVSLSILALMSIVGMGKDIFSSHQPRLAFATSFIASDRSVVLSWLGMQPGEQSILAPSEIADLIPVYTPHYVAWNGYAGFQSVTDAELAKRYVLQELVEPQENEERDHSFPQVFSVYAGNRAARERTWCRWRFLFQKSEEECRVPVQSMIRNQEVLRQLEKDLAQRSPEQFLALLQQFNVDFIVTRNPLPPRLTAVCSHEEAIGTYAIYRCS